MHAEAAKGDLFHRAISRVEFDPLLVASHPVARMQHWRVPLGCLRQGVEASTCHVPKLAEVWLQMREQLGVHVERQQVAQVVVEVEEVQAPAVRCQMR